MSLAVSILRASVYGLQFFGCLTLSIVAAAVQPSSSAAATVLSALAIAVSAILTVVAFLNITRIFKKFSGAQQLGLATSTIGGLVLADAAIAYIISMWDPTHFDGIPLAATGFDLWWTYCVSNSVGYFFTSGKVTASGATALGVLPNVLAVIVGAVMLTFFMGVVLAKVAQNAGSPAATLLSYPVRQAAYTAEELRKRRPAHELRIHRK